MAKALKFISLIKFYLVEVRGGWRKILILNFSIEADTIFGMQHPSKKGVLMSLPNFFFQWISSRFEENFFSTHSMMIDDDVNYLHISRCHSKSQMFFSPKYFLHIVIADCASYHKNEFWCNFIACFMTCRIYLIWLMKIYFI